MGQLHHTSSYGSHFWLCLNTTLALPLKQLGDNGSAMFFFLLQLLLSLALSPELSSTYKNALSRA